MKFSPPLNLKIAGLALVLGALPATPASAASQSESWPDQAIRLIVPFGPGGGSDVVGRILAQHLAPRLGQSVVVENRAGAGGSIGAAQVARATPDGYTLLLGSSSEIVQYPAVNPKVSYDALKDFSPVSQVATVPLVVATSPSINADTMPQLLEYARSHPDTANYGSAGVGSSTHLAMALFLSKSGINMNHVPYKGSAAVVTDLMGGTLHAAMPTLSAVLPHRDSDRIKLLAVSTKDRSPLLPELPGMTEAGIADYDISLWTGILAPQGTPPAIIEKLNKEVNAVLELAEVKQALTNQGAQAGGSTSDQFAQKIGDEAELWKGVVKSSGITLE
ncbi:tripartite tricarboxylate transporter substrate binding protein [Pusillimonas sp. SM2304]|uniref:Bug family tripartite tricarboxylate transporter substrate binding protein n=1 Tax=Pusillimonas sp. SM2304 TaxID=3073241 RepID=UPI00287488F4|nr:tripartite tricarboxylate transporter substrate binding protein [Pusillimonas sp. SM2304]MDS1142017.1 tripartite tricarboxylate transporter substrate binding protein [Pusillimonas sp. SM2304]